MSERTNQAVDRLANALHELSYRDRISINPAIRMLLCPGNPKPEDARHMHAVGLTTELAELLAEAIEQLLITLDTGEMADPAGADDFARTNPDLANDVSSAFTGLDLNEVARQVLNDTDPRDRMTVTRALDAMFGDTQDQQEDGDES